MMMTGWNQSAPAIIFQVSTNNQKKGRARISFFFFFYGQPSFLYIIWYWKIKLFLIFYLALIISIDFGMQANAVENIFI